MGRVFWNVPKRKLKRKSEMNLHLNGISLLVVRVGAAMVGLFGLLGLLLAVVGWYGVISHSVSQRTREIGIRMALGAQRGDVLRMVLKQGMILTLTGIVTGLSAAFAITRLMRGMLYEVSPTDPMVLVAVTVLLVIVALVACWVPARRAIKVDPVLSLREE
jgi:ABC-type antimicrobial peptide transport system permease subunit